LKRMDGIAASRLFLLSSALLALVGCGREGPSPAFDIDELPLLPVTERLRIGSVEDPDWGFSRVQAVDVDARGRIYVLESLDRTIRVFDRDGTFLRRMGGRGEGPGEFGFALSFGVTGDTVWTIDHSLGRLTLFDTAGEVLSTGRMAQVRVPLQTQEWDGTISPMTLRDDGLFMGSMNGQTRRASPEPNGIGPSDTVQAPILLFEPTGEVADTIGWEAYPPPVPRPFKEVEFGGTRFRVPRPPSSEPETVRLAHSYWVVERPLAESPMAGFFRITRLAYPQDTLWSHLYQYRPKEYSAEALDLLAFGGTPMPAVFSPSGGAPTGGALRALQRQIRDAMDFPRFQPPIQQLRAGKDGALWLRREDPGGAHNQWLLIDPVGVPLGLVEVPRQNQLEWVSRHEFIVAEPDGLDVPWIVLRGIGG
jgi:hypothetical protein